MFGAHHLAARIMANVAIWSFLGFGLVFLAAFQDYTMGFAMSALTACKFIRFSSEYFYPVSSITFANLFQALAVHQFLLKVVALQWIFAFVIMGVLFVATLGITVPRYFGKEISFDRERILVEEDGESRPLLNDS